MLQNQQRVNTTQMKIVPCHVTAIIFSDLPSWALQSLGEQAIESEHSNVGLNMKAGEANQRWLWPTAADVGSPLTVQVWPNELIKGMFLLVSHSSGLMPAVRGPIDTNPGLLFSSRLGGGGRIYSEKGFAPRSDPLSFYIPFLTEKVTLSYTFNWQTIPLSHTDNTLTCPYLYIKAHWDLKFQVYEHFFFSSPNYSTQRGFLRR